MSCYTVKRAVGPVKLSAPWNGTVWRQAETAELTVEVAPAGHLPRTRVRMLYDDLNLYGLFRVEDQFVRAVQKADQTPVCQDSCVEFFVRPAGEKKYFNFELNCSGKLLLYHITHCRSGNQEPVPPEGLAMVERFHTLPEMVTEEIEEPVTWYLGFRIPVAFFVRYAGVSPRLAGQIWHANFTKCADQSTHPHWLSWQKLSRLDFHLPDEFGELCFESGR